jgi:hypothetical protein
MASKRSQNRFKSAMDRPKPPQAQRTSLMPRKPNYQFERLDRERTKAAKAAEKAAAKREQKERERAEAEGGDVPPEPED